MHNQWIFGGSPKILGSLLKNVNLSSLQSKSGDVKMVIWQCEVVNLAQCNREFDNLSMLNWSPSKVL